MRATTVPSRYSIQCFCVPISILLACFWLSAGAQAVSPPPDGGYAGANTAEGGAGALFSLTSGSNNTAVGLQALYSVTISSQNTATGLQSPKSNTAESKTSHR